MTRQPPGAAGAGRRWIAGWLGGASAHMGMQGRLVLCFMTLVSLGLGASCALFLNQSSIRVRDIMGEQARQLSTALALASKPAMAAGQVGELRRIGQDLLKARNIVFVAFLDADARPMAVASRDLDFHWGQIRLGQHDAPSLMQVRSQNAAVFGDYLEVIAPILSIPPPAAGESEPAASNTRLLGYVAVGVSQQREQSQLRQANDLVIVVGGVIAFMSLPLAYLMVYRIFQPIRELVGATNKIAAGELETQVASDRPDLIGTLARSFNEMVNRVRHQQENLEQMVLQRTAQLEAANRRLESEIAEKEDFLRAVSHDLNAPLRNISGMATMLLIKHRPEFDPEVIRRLERIQKNVEAETDLISELLELSRIKTRRQKMERVDVGELITQLGEMFENDLKSRQIELLIDTPLPTLNCERARLRQVFQNLIDNAVKYMGEGAAASPLGRQIHVGASVGDTEAEFYVRDTGMGIDPEDLGKVFFVFRRGKNSMAHNVAGKGVGLASVKSIIETYSGRIWAESQVGQGTTFRFTVNGRYISSCPQATETAEGALGAEAPELISAVGR